MYIEGLETGHVRLTLNGQIQRSLHRAGGTGPAGPAAAMQFAFPKRVFGSAKKEEIPLVQIVILDTFCRVYKRTKNKRNNANNLQIHACLSVLSYC